MCRAQNVCRAIIARALLNHPGFAFDGVAKEETAGLINELRQALYSKENFYAHAWQTGDMVLSDNYTLLHGRESFTSNAPRHLRRAQVLGRPSLDNPHLVRTL